MNDPAPRAPGRRLRRGVVILPSAFTLGNLFLGIWAIVMAHRGSFEAAGWMIVGAAVLDLLDGRIARYTATGSEFGAQLDSLVDAISFGVAPALIMYFAFLQPGEWSWILGFLYIVAAVIRLARFNVEQAGSAKMNFHGLPSPTAGATLATFYAFTQTTFWERWLAGVSVPRTAGFLILGMGLLMVSHVLYPVVPRFSTRTWGGRAAIVMAVVTVVAIFTHPAYFFFPVAILYITYGLVRSVLMGFVDRLPDRDPLVDDDEDEPEEARELSYEQLQRGGRGRRDPPRTDDRTGP
jgi:CDP-diacylglycerol---serine O-phosphatidyltransferase